MNLLNSILANLQSLKIYIFQDYLTFLSLILVLFAGLFLFRFGKKLRFLAVMLIFFYSLFFLLDYAYFALASIFYEKGNYLNLITFFAVNIKDAPISTFTRQILLFSGAIIFLFVFCLTLFYFMSKKINNFFRYSFWILILFALLLNPFMRAFGNTTIDLARIFFGFDNSIFVDFKNPNENKNFNKKNIVVVYLESFNRDFLTLFPELTPNLNALNNKIDFTNIAQNPLGIYTIKGLFDSHCGVAYAFPIKNIEKTGLFYNNIKCSSEILKDLGYHLYFLKGAKLSFQYTDEFLKTRKYDEFYGFDDLNLTQANMWGFGDDDLFKQAWNDFNRLSQGDQPFMQGILTIGTHMPNGFLAKSCEDINVSKDFNMLNTIKCTDRLLGEFINKIKNSKYSKNTIIMIQSDHKMPYTIGTDRLYDYYKELANSKNLFLILDDNILTNIQNSTLGSNLDTFATLFGYMGILDEINLGRNLLKTNGIKPLDYSYHKNISINLMKKN